MAAIRVIDLMTKPVFSVGPEANLEEVGQLMRDRHIRHVPITDDAHNVIGVVSHRDLLRGAIRPSPELPRSRQGRAIRQTKVRAIMNSDVEVVDENEHIKTAAELMLASKYGCLPVVDGTRLIGILTEADFIRYVENLN